jgi:hypothetical protein
MPAALQVDYGPELARARIAERVRDKQHQAWNKAKRTGIAFVGPRRLLKLAHTRRARSYEVFGSLNPQFAAAGNRGAATEAVTSAGSVICWQDLFGRICSDGFDAGELQASIAHR